MKNFLVAGMAVLALSGVASANLLTNGGFDDGSTAWNWSSWGGTYFYTAGSDTICSQGWWNGISIWQDSGAPIQANTLYTLTVVARTGDGHGRGVTVNVQDTTKGWSDIISDTTFLFPDADRNDNNVTGPWHSYSVSFKSSDHPSLVGDNMGVSVRVYDDTTWEPNGWGWVHYNSVDLEATPVPEPATLLALGLGALAVTRRRRR